MKWIEYCVPVVRRIVRHRPRPSVRVHRAVRRGGSVATAAKVAGGAVAVGTLACFMVPMWGGAGQPVVTAPVARPYVATPILPSGSVFGGYGGLSGAVVGGASDVRDYAALTPQPGVSVVPIGGPIVVLPGTDTPTTDTPTTVPEPSSMAIFAAGLVGLVLMLRRKRKPHVWTAEDYSSKHGRRN